MTYSVSRKADRHAMALALAKLIADGGFGADIEYETSDGFSDRRVNVTVLGLPHGLGLTIDLEPIRGLNHELGGASVLSWHGVKDPWRLNRNCFQSINECHGHKATDIVDTFDQLTRLLTKRLQLIASGEAFENAPIASPLRKAANARL